MPPRDLTEVFVSQSWILKDERYSRVIAKENMVPTLCSKVFRSPLALALALATLYLSPKPQCHSVS